MHFTAKSEMQMLPFKSEGLGEWLQNSLIQNTEHWTSDCTTPCLPQTQPHQVLSAFWEKPPRTTWKATLCSSKTVKSEVTWDFPVSRVLHLALEPHLLLHWSHLCGDFLWRWLESSPRHTAVNSPGPAVPQCRWLLEQAGMQWCCSRARWLQKLCYQPVQQK